MTDELNLTAARGVVAGAKAAALLTRSNARDCLMVASQRCRRFVERSAYAMRRCSASGVERECSRADAELGKAARLCVEASVFTSASWKNVKGQKCV